MATSDPTSRWSARPNGQRGTRDGKRLLAAGINPLQQMVSSCSGAVVTSLFVTPLDVVKIRLQAQQKPFPKGGCFIYHNGLMDHLCVCSYCTNGNGNGSSVSTSPKTWYRRPGHFTGTMDAFIKITKYEGVTSLWSGLPPTLAMAVPATVVYFTCYDQLKYALGYQETNPDTKHIPIIAGSIARTAAATLISPLELVRTKMQSQQLSYSQLRQAIKTTVQQGGVLSLMEGLGPTLLRDVPFSALYWFGYELVKAHQLRMHGNDRLTFVQSFFSGAISGSIAALLTLPFDVVKTHRQIELGEAEMFHKKRITSTWSIIRRLYKQNGIPSLYAGIVPRLVKIAPACAIMISTYEYGKTFFRTYNESHGALNS